VSFTIYTQKPNGDVIATSMGMSGGTAFTLAKAIKRERPDITVNVFDESRQVLIARFNGEIQRFDLSPHSHRSRVKTPRFVRRYSQ
jgi:hypothetical protein